MVSRTDGAATYPPRDKRKVSLRTSIFHNRRDNSTDGGSGPSRTSLESDVWDPEGLEAAPPGMTGGCQDEVTDPTILLENDTCPAITLTDASRTDTEAAECRARNDEDTSNGFGDVHSREIASFDKEQCNPDIAQTEEDAKDNKRCLERQEAVDFDSDVSDEDVVAPLREESFDSVNYPIRSRHWHKGMTSLDRRHSDGVDQGANFEEKDERIRKRYLTRNRNSLPVAVQSEDALRIQKWYSEHRALSETDLNQEQKETGPRLSKNGLSGSLMSVKSTLKRWFSLASYEEAFAAESNDKSHEQPFSIKLSYARDALGMTGSADDVMTQGNELDEGEAASQIQFILRPTKKAPTKLSIEESSSKRRKLKKSPLISLFRKSRGSGQESSQESTSPPMLSPSGRLFGHTLTELCEDDVMPKPVLDMMQQLFVHGPFTNGMFRKSANQRQCRELQEQLDAGHVVAFDELPILVIGATFKNFLRHLPDCMFQCELYDEWCDAIEVIDDRTAHRIKKVMEKLPKCHVSLIRHVMCVLYHVSLRSDENQMTSMNLGICVGPSMLWPSVCADMAAQADAAKKVPLFIQFIIDHFQEVLGEDTVHLFGDAPQQKSRPDSSTDSDSMHSMLSLQEQQQGLRRMGSSLDSLDNPDIETSALLKTHLFQTNLSRDSGLTSSDTQLYSEQIEPQAIPATDLHQVRTTSLTRSTSQFDEVKPKVEPPEVRSHSHEGALNVKPEDGIMASVEDGDDVAQPVAPPRKTRRRAPDPPGQPPHQAKHFAQAGAMYTPSDNAPHTGVVVSQSGDELISVTGAASVGKSSSQVRTQMSSDSIGSSLDSGLYPESMDSTEFPDASGTRQQQDAFPVAVEANKNDMGELRKSASGAKIYLDEQLLNDSTSGGNPGSSAGITSSPPGSKQQQQGVTAGNGSRRAPPPMREPPSYEESVLRTRGKAAEVRARSANRLSWNASPPDNSGSGNFTGSRVDSQSRLLTREVVAKDTRLVGAVEHQTKVTKGDENALGHQERDTGRRVSEGTPQQMMYTPPQEHGRPKLDAADAKRDALQTLLAENAENKDEVLRKVRVGMTVKGGDIFPKHMRNIIKHSLHDEEFQRAHGRGGMRKADRAGSGGRTPPQRSESFATRPSRAAGDTTGHADPSRLSASRAGVEKSASDTSVLNQFENNARRMQQQQHPAGWKRPSKPPTYQEALERKSLLKNGGLPLYQVSPEDMEQQKEKSSKAAQLYLESMKRYQRQVDEPDTGRANEGHVPVSDEIAESNIRVTHRHHHEAGGDFWRDPPPSRPSVDHTALPHKRHPPPTRQITPDRKPGSTQLRELSPTPVQPSGENRRQSYDRNNAETSAKHLEREISPVASVTRGRLHRQDGWNGERPAEHHSVSPRRSDHVTMRATPRRNSDSKSRNAALLRHRRSYHGTTEADDVWNEPRFNDEYTTTYNNNNNQNNNRERHGRRHKPRDQRLSDTRLENKTKNELNRQGRSGLSRSKSDSSEHLNKLGRFKELQALDSNIIEQYRKSMLNAENEALKDSQQQLAARKPVNQSVRHRDWHKVLAEQYSDMFYTPPVETNNNNKVIYAYASKQPVGNDNQKQDAERTKKRWQPPVHPTKDLIVIGSDNNQSQTRENSVKRERGRRSMPADFSNWNTVENSPGPSEPIGKENNPVYASGYDHQRDNEEVIESRAKNVKELIAEYPKLLPGQSDRPSREKSQSERNCVTRDQTQTDRLSHSRDRSQTRAAASQEKTAHPHNDENLTAAKTQHEQRQFAQSQSHKARQSQQQQQQREPHHWGQHEHKGAGARDQSRESPSRNVRSQGPVSSASGRVQGSTQPGGRVASSKTRPQLTANVRTRATSNVPPAQSHVAPPDVSHPQDTDESGGLTWSVAKLRNLYSQGGGGMFYDPANSEVSARPGAKKTAREATNANANEEYI